MYFARHFPGLGITPEVLSSMTPEETHAMRTVGDKILAGEGEERLLHTKAIMQSNGAKVR